MHADPHEPILVGEQVDVVVAAADRAELLGREVGQRTLGRRVRAADGVEHGVIDELVVVAADAERDPLDDGVHDARQVAAMSSWRRSVRTALLPQPMS